MNTDPSMLTSTIQEVQERLPEIVEQLKPCDQIEITKNGRLVAMLIWAATPKRDKPRQLETMKGSVLYMVPDFDHPLEDFRKHMA